MNSDQNTQRLTAHADQAKVSDIPVSNFMDTSPVVFTPETTIYSAVLACSAEKVSGGPVIDSNGKLLGMVSEFDLLLQAATQSLQAPIAFKKEIIGLRPQDTLKEALVLLYKNKIRKLPVVDQNGALVGVVSRIDVLNRIVSTTA